MGRKVHERRHFPQISDLQSIAKYTVTGRRYIPHNYGTCMDWVPHGQYIEPYATESGPDWSSHLRYIADPDNPDYPAAEIWPNNWRRMRSFPWTYHQSGNEWIFDPKLTRLGLRCVFDGRHPASSTSADELTHTILFGKSRPESMIHKRNGLAVASHGDKTYQVPEYSQNFHRLGSTLAVPRYGPAHQVRSPDTFIPLMPLPKISRPSYDERQRKREKRREIDEVSELEAWKPATPLQHVMSVNSEKK